MNAQGRTTIGGDRGYVEDGAATPGRYHPTGGRLSAKETGFQINIMDAVPIRLRHLKEFDPWKDAGIVNQDIDPAKFIGRGHHPLHVRWCGNIARHGCCPAAGLDNAPSRPVGGSLIIEIVYHHGGALPSEGRRDRHADALLRTRDHGDFVP
jgi:hypothetical protein